MAEKTRQKFEDWWTSQYGYALDGPSVKRYRVSAEFMKTIASEAFNLGLRTKEDELPEVNLHRLQKAPL